MSRIGLAQVVHALATSPLDYCPDLAEWIDIAKPVVAPGGDWPAAVEMAAMSTIWRPALAEAVHCLAEQIAQDIGEFPQLDFWSTACGIIARSYTLGVLDNEFAVADRMDLVWMDLRRGTAPPRTEELLFEGMAIHELVSYPGLGITERAIALVAEADRLIPPDVVDRAFCEVVLDCLL
ncbi:hypothetical protein ACFROC_04375 [Nocardia tengchongensis]|uniref:hypothetical protein n=1 Tax=Nocardia tengchongensis TaxID=2055889 RepID=UPI0036975172